MGGRTPTILQIIPRLDTGGAELSTLEITQALATVGARALVVTEGGRLAGEVAAAGGELLTLPASSKNPLRMLANARALEKLIAREGVALVHARSRAPAWSALVAARRAGVPLVTTYHGAYGEKGRLKRLYNSVMARADRVIANSQYTADLIMQRYGTEAGRIRVIHRGVDLEKFDPATVSAERIEHLRDAWQVTAGRPIILQAARLTGWKGQRVVIEAAGLLKADGRLGEAIVVLAGDDQGRSGYLRELRELAERCGVSDQVRFPGHVTDIPAAFAAAHIGVVASVEPEAFGRAAAEAQAMGCPVIATRIGAPPETVRAAGGKLAGAPTGWLIPPGEPAALAGAIAEALAMAPQARVDMGRAARAHIEDRFTVSRMQAQTLAVYDELIGSGLSKRMANGPSSMDNQASANHTS